MNPRYSFTRWFTVLASVTLLFVLCAPSTLASNDSLPEDSPANSPNVVVILADDLGFSDIGCYGGEIQTPNLDALASNGLRFTRFYNTARCWPTRAALMTGYYAQQVRRDAIPGTGRRGQGARPDWARLLPDMLRPQGYRSYHSGKWHIDKMPIASGFDRSYRMADHGRFFHPQTHFENDKRLPPVKPGTDFYTTTAIANHAIKCLKEHQQEHDSQPFFHFVAFTSPHFPLHAKAEDIARYADRYVEGWDKIREQRFKRLTELGFVNAPLSQVERNIRSGNKAALNVLGPGEVTHRMPWDQMTAEQKRFQATKMAIHAAMVDRMDQEIGRIITQLREMDALDNTLILFLSDNGASAEILVRDDGHDPSAAPGSAASHLCLGPGWAATSNTPFRRHKKWTHQGGISTPLIVHWPDGFTARDELRQNVGHVIDIVPTILAATGAKPFKQWKGQDVPPAPGKDLSPIFARDHSVARDSLWWLHSGNRAFRVGDWKIVASGKNSPWELYNLSNDATETNNLAKKYPEKVKRLGNAWTKQLHEIREVAERDLPKK